MYDRLWSEVEAALRPAALLHPDQAQRRNMATRSSPRPGPIRADLLGNMWAQEWGNIYDIVAPKGVGDVGYDLDRPAGGARSKTPVDMVKIGEGFYSSLGFAPLPATFWERSQFTQPRDREVVCHASAWDVDNKDDLRIKMCIKVNARRLRDHPPRAGPQLLPARLQPAAATST